MKTLTCIVLGFIMMFFCLKTSAQTPIRRADTVKRFFITALEPFDQYPNSDSKKANEHFGLLGNPYVRYIDLKPQDDTLDLNGELRAFWDLRDSAANPDTVLGGRAANNLDVLILTPLKFYSSLDNSRILRFQTERHTIGADTSEYTGFTWHNGSGGKESLVGSNVFDVAATTHAFLSGSERAADQSLNAVKVVAGVDSAGVLCDSMWHQGFLKPLSGCPQYLWTQDNKYYSRKILLKFRVRVDSSIASGMHPDLFRVKVTQITKTPLDTLVKFDENFHHANVGYDTISLRFWSNIDSSDKKTVMRIYWSGKVSLTMDYMDVASAFLDSVQTISYDSVLYSGYGSPESYSYEGLEQNNEARLKSLISNIVHTYKNKAQYIMTREEAPLSNALLLKHAAKLLRDSSGGAMELVSLFHDSADAISTLIYDGFYGRGQPNGFVYSIEGVRRGWLDSSQYADPKVFFTGQYMWDFRSPIPKRTTSRDSASIRDWELAHAPTGYDHHTGVISALPYSRSSYEAKSQTVIGYYIYGQRQSKRACMRDSTIGQRYINELQCGTGSVLNQSDSVGVAPQIIYGAGIRVPTAPEMEEIAHLAVSCGASGFYLYTLNNDRNSENGGLVDHEGGHSENLHLFRDTVWKHPNKDTVVATVSRTLWIGWKERFDSAKVFLPRIRAYGDALLNAKYIGDWTAAELPYASLKNSLPFFDSSIFSLDDSLRKDAFKINHTDGSVDTANRTFVHISMWLDTTTTAILNHTDTMLYITNMRTDDSYDTTEVPTTIDRRLITMQMKARHLIQDVIDTNGYLALDNRKIWTPYVGALDSLRILLLPGDGILVRLLPPADTMKQMRVAMNYPQGGKDFNDYGRIKFDKPVKGVLDPTTSSKYSVPSSRYSYVGIRDVDTVKLWQDSLLYIKVDNVEKSRKGYWRNQNWTQGAGGIGSVIFNYKNTLPASPSRVKQVSFDSLSHNIVIKTDLEGRSSNGKIRFKDPFLVDSLTLTNVQDTLAKSSPFLPHTLNPFRGQGVDSEHYGGIFLKQNVFRDSTTPIYATNAFSTIFYTSHISKDTLPSYTDWAFLEWVMKDTIAAGDPFVWKTDPDSAKILFQKDPALVIGKDSAQYIARYKSHMAAYTESGNLPDSGNCCNNQRKLIYMGKDSIGRRMLRYVYSSGGRIYTTVGTRTGTDNNAIVWKPEQLLSSWNNNHSHYPSVGNHPQLPEKYHYTYQDDSTHKIKLAMLDSFGVIHAVNISDTSDYLFATPAISSTDFINDPIDAIAWATAITGVHVRIISWAGGRPSLSNVINLGQWKHARYPTVWIDSCDTCSVPYSSARLWVAWQQDTTITVSYSCCDSAHGLIRNDSIITDIFVEELRVSDTLHGTPKITPRSIFEPTDVSRKINTFSFQNQRPCITGERLKPFSSEITQVKLAYESIYSPDSMRLQGIEVANFVPGSLWTNMNFLTSADTGNTYWKPSIEVSRYHKVDTGLVQHQHWYSILHEIHKGRWIQHWAFDGRTQRLTSNIFQDLQDPQIALTPTKIDSDLYRMAMTPAEVEPRWLISGYSGTFKLGTNDSLWGYHTMTEKDTSTSLQIESGFGELAVDDGTGMAAFDLQERDDELKVDSTHDRNYFMQSNVFTLPSGGSLQYCPWVRPSDNALYMSRFDTLKYALDFYDTLNVFKSRIDSMIISDSNTRIRPKLRTISIVADSNKIGFVVFHRISGSFDDTAAVPQSIISSKRISYTTASYKRGDAFKSQSSSQPKISLTTAPNPFKNEVNVYLSIPASGDVTIEAFTALGSSLGYVCKEKLFSYGQHEIVWKAGKLPSGTYILRMNYGNEVVSARVVAIE